MGVGPTGIWSRRFGRIRGSGLGIYVTQVGSQGQQKEKGAQHVFPLGSPGDGFNVQRVPGEERSDESAAPPGSREPVQEQKEQQRIGYMKEDIGHMMTSGIQPVDFTIYHMRNPGDGVPVAGVGGSEGPGDTLPSQPVLNVQVLRDVILVIKIDEIVMSDRPKADEGQNGKRETDTGTGAGKLREAAPRAGRSGLAGRLVIMLIHAFRSELLRFTQNVRMQCDFQTLASSNKGGGHWTAAAEKLRNTLALAPSLRQDVRSSDGAIGRQTDGQTRPITAAGGTVG